MASIKVFHRLDASTDGTDDVSRHVSINELVNEYEYVGRTGFRLGTDEEGLGDIHPADAFDEAIDRFTYGPGASNDFLKREVRALRPGDILIRKETGESVIITRDGYEVLDLTDVSGRVTKDSDGIPTDPVTFPDYDPTSNVSFDPEEHTYDRD